MKSLARLSLKDCRRILGVSEGASAAEIKRAFREKAKRLHPDVSGHSRKNKKEQAGGSESSEMLDLLEAYRTLSDPALKERADSEYAHFRSSRASKAEAFDYRLWLLARKDPKSRAKLIFFDLLHGFEEEAVAIYLELKRGSGGFSLSDCFDREDFMDCGFILAEELNFRDELYEAFALLSEIVACEYQKPYFRHFFPEALDFLRNVLRKIGREALQGTLPDSLALECFERALELKLSDKDDALILLQMAECCERLGDEYAAAICRREAEKLSRPRRGAFSAVSRAEMNAKL